MNESIEKENDNNRKQKQEYLKAKIIKENYDPGEFTNYLSLRREDGDDIDNWSLDELENEVIMFKRLCESESGEISLKNKLDHLELNEKAKCNYFNRLDTVKKKRTVIGQNNANITIKHVEIVEGGLFFGKYLVFTLYMPELDLTVQRTETDFKVLYDLLKREFSFLSLPPLIKLGERTFTDQSLTLQRRYYKRFLDDCVAHEEIRNSLALETFMTCQSGKEFSMKMKEIHKYFDKNIVIDKNFTKKRSDYQKEDPIAIYPTCTGSVDVKLSPLIQNRIAIANAQFGEYKESFEQMEKLSKEFEKTFTKLIDLHTSMKKVFDGLKQKTAKFNSVKPRKSVINLVEHESLNAIDEHFNNLGEFIS